MHRLKQLLRGCKRVLPLYGDEKASKRIDEVFSRSMLGSVLLGGAAGKIVEKLINLGFDSTFSLLGGWSAAFVVFLIAFVWWEELEEAKDELTDTVADD